MFGKDNFNPNTALLFKIYLFSFYEINIIIYYISCCCRMVDRELMVDRQKIEINIAHLVLLSSSNGI